jgi:hypothetical protein
MHKQIQIVLKNFSPTMHILKAIRLRKHYKFCRWYLKCKSISQTSWQTKNKASRSEMKQNSNHDPKRFHLQLKASVEKDDS